MYAWATPEYMLERMSLVQIYMYYEYGLEQKEIESNILVNRIAVGFFGAEEPKKSKSIDTNEKPDKAAFYETYGDKIKRPEGTVKE